MNETVYRFEVGTESFKYNSNDFMLQRVNLRQTVNMLEIRVRYY